MHKLRLIFILLFISCGAGDVQSVESSNSSSSSTTVPVTTTTTTVPQTTTTVPVTTTTTTVPQTTTTVPVTTTTTTVPQTTSYSLKFGEQINQFPEIPYCKMQYEEVEKQLKEYFLKNNIRLTIREYRVETSNTDCYGLVSGSNYSYLDEISDGKFVEITVESDSSQRRFPSTIAYSPNAIGNNEFFDLFCDLSGDYVSDKFWMGELGTGLISPYDQRKYRDSLLYTSPNYGRLDIDLTDPLTDCATDVRLDEMCYWRYQEQNPYANENLVIYRHYEFDAKQHYGSENVTNACSDKEIENLKTSTKNTINVPTYESSETTSYSLKFGDQINQFPEIPYCKMQYEEVEKQLKEYFLKNNIRLTIRKFLVETNNNDCYGLASGSNYSYLDEIKDGGFVEITVEWNSSKREFPTTIANSPNAVGNGERWDLYCDNSGKSYLRDDWQGIKNGSASDQYFYLGLYIDLTSPYISCVPNAMLSSIGYFFGDGYACKNTDCDS